MKKTKKFNTKVLAVVLTAVLVVALLTPSFASPDTSEKYSYWFLPVDIDCGKVSFPDVSKDYWGHDAIEIFAQCGYINGYPDGTFMPDKPVDYAEFYTMLVRAQFVNGSGQYLTGGNPWWKPFLDVARDCGFTKGTLLESAYTNGQWDVSKVGTPMTRYEMAQAISSYIDAMTGSLPSVYVDVAGHEDVFQYDAKAFDAAYNVTAHGPDFMPKTIADEASIPTNYLHAVQQNYEQRILTGVDAAGTFNGNSGITRAQAAAALVRLLFHSNCTLTPSEQKDWDAYLGSGFELVNSTTAPATGYLTNGKPITEENIVEMLKELEKAYPHLSQWNGDSKYSFTSEVARQTVGLAKWEGCGSFAYMLTAQIFGDDPTVNPPRIHQNFDELKVGDIIVHMNKGDWAVTDWPNIGHFDVAIEIGEFYGMKYLRTVGGNVSGGVAWAWAKDAYQSFDSQFDSNDFIITRW